MPPGTSPLGDQGFRGPRWGSGFHTHSRSTPTPLAGTPLRQIPHPLHRQESAEGHTHIPVEIGRVLRPPSDGDRRVPRSLISRDGRWRVPRPLPCVAKAPGPPREPSAAVGPVPDTACSPADILAPADKGTPAWRSRWSVPRRARLSLRAGDLRPGAVSGRHPAEGHLTPVDPDRVPVRTQTSGTKVNTSRLGSTTARRAATQSHRHSAEVRDQQEMKSLKNLRFYQRFFAVSAGGDEPPAADNP